MATEMDSAVDALMHIVNSRPGTPPVEDQKQPIQAYAKLQGEDFVYYIRSLSLLLGRKTGPYDEVQVDLGTSKVISRVHARIEYNFVSRTFEIACLGKNGVFIDGKFLSKDASSVLLESKYCALCCFLPFLSSPSLSLPPCSQEPHSDWRKVVLLPPSRVYHPAEAGGAHHLGQETLLLQEHPRGLHWPEFALLLNGGRGPRRRGPGLQDVRRC